MSGSSPTQLHAIVHRLPAIAVVLALVAAATADAQFAIGLKGGANISNLSVTENGAEPAIPYESRTGLLLGATAGVTVTPWLTVQLEGRFSQEGTQQTEDGVTASLRLSYVDVPLVAKVLIPTGRSPLTPHLYAGGFAGFEIDCGLNTTGAVSLELDCDVAAADRQSTDYGVVFGGGADLRLGPGTITLDVEYALGLRNMHTEPGGKAHSRVFALAAGYKVGL